MKYLLALTLAALGFVLTLVGMDVFAHDQTYHEVFKGMPIQMVHSVGDLFGLAWQYKFPSFVAFAIAMAVLYVRRVPEIRNQ